MKSDFAVQLEGNAECFSGDREKDINALFLDFVDALKIRGVVLHQARIHGAQLGEHNLLSPTFDRFEGLYPEAKYASEESSTGEVGVRKSGQTGQTGGGSAGVRSTRQRLDESAAGKESI